MVKKLIIYCLFFFLYSQSSFAKFVLNIGIINKKGADSETPLVSEYYSREEVYNDPVVIKTKDQLILKVSAAFAPEVETYGPSNKITIQGELINSLKNERKPIFITISLGEKVTEKFSFSSDRVIELIFEPVL